MSEFNLERFKKELILFIDTIDNISTSYLEIDVSGDNKKLLISLTNMYNYFDFTYDVLFKFAEFLKTNKIDLIDKDNPDNGCGSCGYGSTYNVTILAYDVLWK